MYQQIKNISQTEANFNKLYEIFNNQVFNLEREEGDNSEYDLTANYSINHVCAWNKVKALGLTCSIVQKNDHIAIVRFNNKDDIETAKSMTLLNCIFRLEDLSKL